MNSNWDSLAATKAYDKTHRILIGEDDLTLAKGLQMSLKNEGFDVCHAADGNSCIDLVVKRNPDLILLDVMLPDMTGFDVCREVRSHGMDAIIIMLTVRGQELDRVLGLEMGADDYMTKPFSLREMVARIRAHLRRRMPRADQLERYKVGDCDFDFETLQATRKGREMQFTAKEFELMRMLVTNRGEVLTRDRILQEVWGYDSPNTRTVDNHIMRLRHKIEQDPARPRFILSAYGVGYKFVG